MQEGMKTEAELLSLLAEAGFSEGITASLRSLILSDVRVQVPLFSGTDPVNEHAGTYSAALDGVIDFLLILLQHSLSQLPRHVFIRTLLNDWFYFEPDAGVSSHLQKQIRAKLWPFSDECWDNC